MYPPSLFVPILNNKYFLIEGNKKVSKKRREKKIAKGASSHSPESRYWPDSKSVQQWWWAARKPAAPYVRCAFRSLLSHVDFAESF